MEILRKAALSQTAKSDALLPQNASQKVRENPLEHEQMTAYLLIIRLHTRAPPLRRWLP